jgi:demethylmenaquinone methyltransferase / 2-methoxy-6-polyprenyl-1,4-benzoquinol methylase
MPEASAIADMFSGIAPRYDLANHVLSFGLDFGWRRRLVCAVAAEHPRRVADLATGSGDVAFALKKQLGTGVEVRGLDFCAPMLAAAERKKAARPWAREIVFALGDCLNLPLADDSQDALTIAWGVRNLADRERGFAELRRVLRPGGRLFVLDNSQPEGWTRPFCRFYLNAVVPVAGGVLTGQPAAYRYLATSSAAFPSRAALAAEMTATGFTKVRHEGLAGGAVALHEAEK